jgi:hypothetical protein
MGLISEEVEVALHPTTIKYYEDLDYQIPRILNKWGKAYTPRGTKIKIKVENLTDGSHAQVEVKCDGCGEKLSIEWKTYKYLSKNNGEYYCKKCAINLYAKINSKKTKLQNGKSFEQWCINNNRQDILERWDFELNDCKPNEITYGTDNKYYFKCPKGLHESELKEINSLTSGRNNTFECYKCGSVAQWGIDNLGTDFLDKYWDYEKNVVNPWEIPYGYDNKVYIKCQEKDYHGSYDVLCRSFVKGNRCPFCRGMRVHPKDSLGQLLENNNLLNIWSDKNKKSPYEFAPMSHQKVYWKCPDGHEDYPRSILDSNSCNFRCPMCQNYVGELSISNHLIENNVDYIPQKTFPDCKYKSLLKFDFYLLDFITCVEYQGIQHYEPRDFAGRGKEWAEEQFKLIQIKDQIKRDYCKNNNIKLIEIPYWEFDNIETILKENLIAINKSN